jgi:hypothetical protein
MRQSHLACRQPHRPLPIRLHIALDPSLRGDARKVLLQPKRPAESVVGPLLYGCCDVSTKSVDYEGGLGYVLRLSVTVGLLTSYDGDQEWNVYRYSRKLYCLNDWKPVPPWNKTNDPYMERHYDMRIPYQYSYEHAEYSRCCMGMPANVAPDTRILKRREYWWQPACDESHVN